jgi:hypothetical protein
MMFRIVITEVDKDALASDPTVSGVQRYAQVVDAIDLPKIISAINTPPRKKRERKTKVA